MSFWYRLFEAAGKIHPFRTASAHCDIPCGIYDPHLAQVAAHTVIRMVDLIAELPKPTADMPPKKREEYVHKLARYTAVKEEHAEIVKKEIRILWGDYFKPEHLEKHPELHDLVWKVMKRGSQARQDIDRGVAEELLKTVQKIAEIFWKTKNLEPVRVKAPYPSGGELVLHK